MRSVADVAVRKQLEGRLSRLTPETSPRWGRMNVHQMLEHVAGAMERVLANDSIFEQDVRVSGFVRFVALSTPLPWPKGAKLPSNPADVDVPASEFERARQRVADGLSAMSEWEPTALTPPHAVFGRLTTDKWHVWAYKHAHHHLKQFGV